MVKNISKYLKFITGVNEPASSKAGRWCRWDDQMLRPGYRSFRHHITVLTCDGYLLPFAFLFLSSLVFCYLGCNIRGSDNQNLLKTTLGV